MLGFQSFSVLTFISLAIATGTFTNPSGSDGSLSVTEGDTIDISWTNTTDYGILSLGYYSGSNQTITWLISDSTSKPTSYRWTVDAIAQGFNLADSRIFAFYICEGLNFGDPFISSYFVINDGGSTTTSTSVSPSTTLTTPTPTSNSVISTNNSATSTPTSNNPTTTGTASTAASTHGSSSASSSSSSLSGGAIAGIVIGVIGGLLIIAALVFFLLRRRRQQRQGSSHLHNDATAYEKTVHTQQTMAYPQGDHYAPYAGMHEAQGSTPHGHGHGTTNGPAELPSERGNEGRAELPGGR